jgi:hypothetical protein
MVNRFILSSADTTRLRYVLSRFFSQNLRGRFRTPDTAQPEYVYYGVDTKTADMGRRHSYREKKF